MKSRIISSCIFFLLTLLSTPVFTQIVKQLGIETGISNNYITAISQDRRGFLWFATESGLNRFDGKRIKVYKKNKPNSISGNELNKVYADKYEDVVWIATQRDGLNRFDYHTEKFHYYRHQPSDSSGIITNDITDVINSSDGNLWLSTYHRGVEYFNKQKEIFVHYNTETIPTMVSNNVWCIAEDNSGHLYIGHVSKGLSILSWKDGTIRNYQNDPLHPESLPGNEVRAIYIDSNNNVWIGTNNGLALFNPLKENFITFQHNKNDKKSLVANYIYSIKQLTNGKLWIGTENAGVSILDVGQLMFSDPKDVVFSNLTYEQERNGYSNTIRSIHEDDFQNVWLGTYGGGVTFISHRPEYFNIWEYSVNPNINTGLNRSTAWGICADRNFIWVGTDGGGINLFKDGEHKQIYTEENTPTIKDNFILSAFKASNQKIWFGTFKGGVSIYDPSKQAFVKADFDLSETDVRCFYQDDNKIIWIGTGNGLYKYNPISSELNLFTNQSSGFPNNLVRTITKDENDRLWLGFFGGGLVILDEKMQIIKHFDTYNGFPSNTVNYLFQDSKKQMWVATGEGLVQFESVNKLDSFQILNEKNYIRDSHIKAITEDQNANIWFSTNEGICRIIPSNGRVFNYNHSFGTPLGNFMSGSVAKDSTGIIYFGSQNGVCYFNPLLIPTEISLSPTIISGLEIYGNKMDVGDLDIPLTDSKVKLSSNQNTFKVDFNVQDYSLNDLTEYTYMLKGLEDRWYKTDNNSITFRNIPHGSYELIIRTRIKNQQWSELITSMVIIINPPFWLSWWAKLLYILTSLVVVFLILLFYKRKLDLENKLLFEKQNHQREQELNTERLRFFTNITHELRTPLTLILGPLDDLYKDTDLSKKHSAKISLIYKSATRLLNLINQILEFRKTEAQGKKLSVIKADISILIKEIGIKYKELNTNNRIKFDIVIDTEKTSLYFDVDVISTILENLLSNAFKFTKEGDITLILRSIIENNVAYTEIELKDTGRGIPAESISKIFDRYYQAEPDLQIPGTGIGLALVHNLVNIHQGIILVESKQGEGTAFRFRLVSDNTYPDAYHKETSSIAEDGVNIDMPDEVQENKQIILVIEDNKDISTYIAESLAEHYRIIVADNGKEGSELAFIHIPDLIISDVMMPEMDGFELSQLLKQDIRTSHIPIIILTAKDSIRDRTEGYNIGVESYITKPFSADLLKSRIVNLLEARTKIADLINKNTVASKEDSIPSLSKIDNEFLKQVIDTIEQYLDSDEVNIAFIADKMNMSHSTLYRKIKSLSGISINEFIRKVRIQNAGKLLLSGKYTISEISYMVGINSITYFRQCFKDEFGMTPSDFIKSKSKLK